MLKGHQAVGAMPGLTMLVDLFFKTSLQPGLCREGAHKRESLDRLPQQAGELTHFFLAAFGGGHHPGSKQADQPDDQGCKQQD